MYSASLFTFYGRQQGRDEPLRADLDLDNPGHYDECRRCDARRKRTGFIIILIQVENYFVIHSPGYFFSVLFRSVGAAPPVNWWQLVGAVYLIYLVILLIGIFSSRYGFRESRRGWQQLSCLDVYSLNDSTSQCRASGSVEKCIFAHACLMLFYRSVEFLFEDELLFEDS